MMQKALCQKVVAFAIRSSRYSYAVFANPKCLLDWGMGEIVSRNTGSAAGAKRAEFLLSHFRPGVVAVMYMKPKCNRVPERASSLIRFLRRQALFHGYSVTFIHRKEIALLSRSIGATAKYGIAASLVRDFPELQWKVPQKRKIWQHEPHALMLFDAIAAGVTYWRRSCKSQSECQEKDAGSAP